MSNRNKIVASNVVTREGYYTARDAKFINKVAALVIKYGAVSVERAARLLNESEFSVMYAFWHLDAKKTSSGLYVLPE